jgi:hypothetical protein
MPFVRLVQPIVWAALLIMYAATVALTQNGLSPARYRDGALPQIPLQALGGGEVWLELTVSAAGVVDSVRSLRDTPPFTEALGQAVGGWRFDPAREETSHEPGAPANLGIVDSTVLVAGVFRPPAIYMPAPGEPPPAGLAPASEDRRGCAQPSLTRWRT